MTQKEAIETIKIAGAEVEWEYPMDYKIALDMAAHALKAWADLVDTKNRLKAKEFRTSAEESKIACLERVYKEFYLMQKDE